MSDSKKPDYSKPFAYKNTKSTCEWLVEPVTCYKCTNVSTGRVTYRTLRDLESTLNSKFISYLPNSAKAFKVFYGGSQ